MATVTTEAIALRRTPFGETSQIAHFFTRSAGRVSLILKGVHRPKSRLGGSVDLLDVCRVSWSTRRSRSLPPLRERKVLSHHPGLRSRADLIDAGLYLAELVLALVPEEHPQPQVFELCRATLDALDRCPEPSAVPSVVFALEGGMLRMSGFEPVLDRCVVCNRVPEGFHLLQCDLARGGVVCSLCRSGEEQTFRLSTAAARVVDRLGHADPRSLVEVVLPGPVAADVRRFYRRTLSYLMERPPRCAPLAHA